MSLSACFLFVCLSNSTTQYFYFSIFDSEDMIALAILRLVEIDKCVVEGAGASGLAALLCGKLPELKGKRLV